MTPTVTEKLTPSRPVGHELQPREGKVGEAEGLELEEGGAQRGRGMVPTYKGRHHQAKGGNDSAYWLGDMF